VPAETRSRTGWILPVAVGMLIGGLLPETAERAISQSERLWTGGMALAGFIAGVLWQWYSPRDLVKRLQVPAAGVIGLAVIFMLPADWSSDSPAFGLWFPLGIVAGLVFMTTMQRDRAADDKVTEEQSPGT
jgi:peptidoglycan/LPS O-acetylase OafA/YrhL